MSQYGAKTNSMLRWYVLAIPAASIHYWKVDMCYYWIELPVFRL